MNVNPTTNPNTAARLNRIRRVSRIFQRLCVVLFGILFVFAVFALCAPRAPIESRPEQPGNGINSPQGMTEQAGDLGRNPPNQGLVAVTSVTSYAIGLGQPLFHLDRDSVSYPWLERVLLLIHFLSLAVGLVILYRLFGLYGTGAVFTAATVYCFKLIGYWLLGLWGLTHLFELSKLAWSPHPQMHFSLDEKLFGGLLILLIAWVMEEGRELQEEHELTI
jgi:hypothetical protein